MELKRCRSFEEVIMVTLWPMIRKFCSQVCFFIQNYKIPKSKRLSLKNVL